MQTPLTQSENESMETYRKLQDRRKKLCDDLTQGLETWVTESDGFVDLPKLATNDQFLEMIAAAIDDCLSIDPEGTYDHDATTEAIFRDVARVVMKAWNKHNDSSLAVDICADDVRERAQAEKNLGDFSGKLKTMYINYLQHRRGKQATGSAGVSEELAGAIGGATENDVSRVVSTATRQASEDKKPALQSSETDTAFGRAFDRGYMSPLFATPPGDTDIPENPVLELHDAYVLLAAGKLTDSRSLVPLLEAVAKTGKPLLIVCEDAEGEALALLILQKLRGKVNCCVVKAPSYGARQKEALEGLAAFLSTKVVTDVKHVTLEDLGHASVVTVDNERTTILWNKTLPTATDHEEESTL